MHRQLEKQKLLHTNLERITNPFPNNLALKVPQWYWLSQIQSFQKTYNLPRSEGGIKFIPNSDCATLREDWRSTAHLGELQGESLFCLKQWGKEQPQWRCSVFMPNTAFQQKPFIPRVKHGGGRAMIWSWFATTGSEHPAVIESTTNSSVYQSHGLSWLQKSFVEITIMKKDDDPKLRSKSGSEQLINILINKSRFWNILVQKSRPRPSWSTVSGL